MIPRTPRSGDEPRTQTSRPRLHRILNGALAPTLLLAATAALALALPGEGDQAATALPSDPVFEALRTDGTRLQGRIAAFGPDGTITFDTEEGPVTLPLDAFVSLTRDGAPANPGAVPDQGILLFPGGDRLRALIGPAEDGALRTLPAVLDDAPLPVPRDALLGAVLDPPTDAEARDALLRCVGTEARDADVLWLANGDRLAGAVAEIGPEAIGMELDTGRADIPQPSVVAIGFDPVLVDYPEPEGSYLELSFVDGSRLGVVEPRLEQGRLVATTRFGVEVRPEVAAVARIVVRSPAVAYLSERAESAVEYVGYLGHHPGTYGRDRTWDDHPLRLGGVTYDRGLGTLPRTLLAYVLQPGVRRFQATVGLDDRAGDRASVVFRVLVDGRERFATPPLTKRDQPVAVDVDVTGARVLILATEFGESGDVEDFADWVEARLVR